jgi:hypothetical protein
MGLALSLDLGNNSVPPAVSFAATLIGIALIVFLIYTVFDYRIDKQDKAISAESGEAEEEEFKFSDLVELIKNRSFLYIALLCVAFYSAVFPFIQYAADLLVNKFGFSYVLPEADYFAPMGNETLGTVLIFVSLFIFGLSFSMIPSKMKSMAGKLGSLAVILVLFILFVTGLGDTLSAWFQNGPKTASLIPMGTILFTPIFGNFVDKRGKAASLMILGASLLIFAHLSLSVFNSQLLAYFGLISLGIAFSLVPAAMWPSVAKIVKESRLGTAYASMFTIQNWGLVLFFWGIGAVLDLANRENLDAIQAGEATYNYTVPIFMLVILGVISIFLAFQLKRADAKQKYGLELPSGQKPE